MPFRLPFSFPPFFNNRNNFNNYYNYHSNINNKAFSSYVHPNNFVYQIEENSIKKNNQKKDSERTEPSEPFFEIFGLKFYFDDILIICLLFFLYNEKVKNDELFICLILLLLS